MNAESGTYVYVMGLQPSRTITLEQGLDLEADSCNVTYDEMMNITIHSGGHSDLDLSLAIATLRRTYAQLRFSDCFIKNQSDRTSCALWWCLTLSAFLSSKAVAFFASDVPLGMVSRAHQLHTLTSNLIPMPKIFNSFIDENKCQQIEQYAPNMKTLIEDERFRTAVTSLWDASFSPHTPMQMAIIWTGIEACFPFEKYKGKNLRKTIPEYLDADITEESIESLWNSRNKSVHEGILPSADHLRQSEELLSTTISKAIVEGTMPLAEEK